MTTPEFIDNALQSISFETELADKYFLDSKKPILNKLQMILIK